MSTDWDESQTAEDLIVPTAETGRDLRCGRPLSNPLGPVIEIRHLERPRIGRLYAGGVFLGVSFIVGIALWLVPAKDHVGTHRQLGLLPCGFLTMTGYPCPTCGMTTAFAHAVRGQVVDSIRSQPAGFVLALVTIIIGGCAAGAMTVGRYPVINWYRVNPTSFVWYVAVGLVVAWAVKIALGLLDGSLPAR
ncbi:MAG: DUF2752 domain-containing protein [Phycisphaerae bacterium]